MLLTLILCVLSFAGEDELYDPAPPAGAAFVRFVNPGQPAPAAIAGRDVGSVPGGSVSAYVVAEKGVRTLSLGSQQTEFDVAAGGFYTLYPAADQRLVVITDEANTNLAKAQLALYNLSSTATVDLKTADGVTTILAGVGPGQRAQRLVNPIAVDLAVYSGDQVVQRFDGLSLGQGSGYSAVVLGSESPPLTAIWVQSRTDTTQ